MYDTAEYDFDDTYEYNFNVPAKNNFDNAAGPGRRPAEGLVNLNRSCLYGDPYKNEDHVPTVEMSSEQDWFHNNVVGSF